MGLIDDTIRQTASAALDSLLAPAEAGGLGKHCRLLFPPRETRCPNCRWDGANRRSANHYNGTGPQPFPDGSLCPVCVGKGVLLQEVGRDVVFLCNWAVRTWVKVPGIDPQDFRAEVPGGYLQTKGFVKDMPAVLQARKMVLQTSLEGVLKATYALEGEPFDPGNIVQGRYFLAVWRRAAS